MHNINLNDLTRVQLQQLAKDVSAELRVREHEERAALIEKLKSEIEAAGFDPHDLHFAPKQASRRKKEKPDGGAQ